MLILPAEKIIILKTKLAYIWENLSFVLPAWLLILLVCSLAIFLILRSKKKSILVVVGVNFFIFVALIATLIFVAELYFRFIFDCSGSLGNLQTTKRWSARHVTYNADYFRDRNFSTKKDPDTTRIAVVGDSFAFGWGVANPADRFSDLLQVKLNQPDGKKYEVYNAAVPGWESKDELQFLEERAGLFSFDTIILSYFLNDIYKDRAIELDYVDKRFEKILKYPLLKPIFDKSYLLEFTAAIMINYFNGSNADISQREITLYQDPESWANHEKTLSQIIDWSGKNNQRLIVVIFPFINLVGQDPYPANFIHQNLKKLFQARKIEVIDLYPYLKKYPPDKLRVNPFDYHPSVLVNKIVADLLFEQMQKDF